MTDNTEIDPGAAKAAPDIFYLSCFPSSLVDFLR